MTTIMVVKLFDRFSLNDIKAKHPRVSMNVKDANICIEIGEIMATSSHF